jgi:hypothetical protein
MKVFYTNDANNRFWSIFIYGLAGAGKTPLAATLPNPIIVTSEPGLRSLQDIRIPYIFGRNKKEAMDALQWICQSAEARQYQSVFFDSISANSEWNLADEKRKSSDPRRFSPATTAATMEMVMAYLDIPIVAHKHLVMTCKAMKNTEPTPGSFPIEPLTVVPKLGPALPYHFDEVLYLSRHRNEQHQEYAVLTCRTNDLCLARDRSGKLDLYEPPNLTHIINKTNGVA